MIKNTKRKEKYGELLVYNTPKAVIISRNKIASRVLDSYYYSSVYTQLRELDIKLTKAGEARWKNNQDRFNSKKEFIFQLLLDVSEGDVNDTIKNITTFNIVNDGLGSLELIHSKQFPDIEDKISEWIDSKSVKDVLGTLELIWNDSETEVEKCLTKKTKKEIVIFIRNPKRRIISGVIQDFFDIFNNMTPKENHWFKLYLKEYNATYYSILEDIFSSEEPAKRIPSSYSTGENNLEKDVITPFIQKLYNDWAEANLILRTHSDAYAYLIDQLIQKIDENKLKIINIDYNRFGLYDDESGTDGEIDFDTILTSFYGDDFTLSKTDFELKEVSNKKWFSSLASEILKQKEIDVLIDIENFFFDKLKNHPNNILKPIGKK